MKLPTREGSLPQHKNQAIERSSFGHDHEFKRRRSPEYYCLATGNAEWQQADKLREALMSSEPFGDHSPTLPPLSLAGRISARHVQPASSHV